MYAVTEWKDAQIPALRGHWKCEKGQKMVKLLPAGKCLSRKSPSAIEGQKPARAHDDTARHTRSRKTQKMNIVQNNY